ncbi:hypothetical protein [Microbacterium sp. CPCC 204701]|nr:hypothetical protein [Microbacterium sp. CPCC 204701]
MDPRQDAQPRERQELAVGTAAPIGEGLRVWAELTDESRRPELPG